MKPNWKTAHVSVREQVEDYLRDGTAESRRRAQDLVWSLGCDIEAPPTRSMEKVAELRAAKDFRELNRLYLLTNLDADARQEAANLARWQGMRRWASEPSAAERAAETLRIATEQAREAEIEARALAIVASENAAMLDRARKQARKELTR